MSVPPGPAHHLWKDGRHSRYHEVIPRRLGERYAQALGDGDLLNMTEEIALIDAHLGDLLERVEQGEGASLWLELRERWKAYEAALAATDVQEMQRQLGYIGSLISRGAIDALAWREIRDVLRDRRGLVESERKRRIEIQAMLDVREGMAFLESVIASVERHVDDHKVLAAIAADLRPYIATPSN